MNKTVKIILGIIVVGLVICLITYNKKTNPETQEPIKIGALLLLSGDFTTYGEAGRNAVEMVVEEYNNRPDVVGGKLRKVEVIYEDTHGDPKTAVSAYQKLVTLDRVSAIIGPQLQTEMTPLTPLVQKDKLPMFSIAPIPIADRGTTSNPLVIWPNPTLESEQMAQYVYDQGARTVAVFNTTAAWEAEVAEAFKAKFESLGGRIVAHEVVLETARDTSLPVTKILREKPDAIYVATYYKFLYFVKKSRELGYTGKLYSIEIDAYLADETKPYSDSLQFISPPFYTQEFIEKYESIYGVKPSLPTGHVYDGMNMFLDMISESKSNEDVLKKMEDLRMYEGVSGTIRFTDDHQAVFPFSMFEINNGGINKLQ